MELKELDPSSGFFTANGIKYIITKVVESLGIARYNEYEKLRFLYSMNTSVESLVATIQQMQQMTSDIGRGIGKANIFHLATLQNELIDRYINKEQRTGTMAEYYLMLCTLFINEEGEDTSQWSKELAETKIKNWIAEGYRGGGFFLQAKIFLQDLIEDYTKSMGHGLEEKE